MQRSQTKQGNSDTFIDYFIVSQMAGIIFIKLFPGYPKEKLVVTSIFYQENYPYLISITFRIATFLDCSNRRKYNPDGKSEALKFAV